MTREEELPARLQDLLEDLDSAGPAQAQSDAAALALVGRALSEAHGAGVGSAPVLRLPRRRVAVRVAIAVTALGMSAAAAAWVQGMAWWRESDVGPVIQQPESAGGSIKTKFTATESPHPDVAPVDSASAPLPGVPSPAHAPAPSASTGARQDGLALANRLRREGELARAEQIYLDVVRAAPGSSSAYVARVAVAQMRLGSQPRSAIHLLLEARAQAPGGALDQEVLEALARAYRSLGDRAAERRELTGLLKQYPNSVGAEAAQRRLSTLGSR